MSEHRARVDDGLAGPVSPEVPAARPPVIDPEPGACTPYARSGLFDAVTGSPDAALNPGDTGTGPIHLGVVAQYGGLLDAAGFADVPTPAAGYTVSALSEPVPSEAGPAQPRPVASRRERQSTVALFLVHMFPIGRLPIAMDCPATQLPVPLPEFAYASGLRFAPYDHPASDVIDDNVALANVVAGARGAAAKTAMAVPATLTAAHDPLGGLSQREWNRRFFAGTRASVAEFAWPPGELYPEGGREPGQAVMVPEGTLLDRFGVTAGRIFAVDGTPFANRSLPPVQLTMGYRRYRVLRELPMWQALSASWFAQPGGGVRYRAVHSAAELVTLGYLADITGEDGW